MTKITRAYYAAREKAERTAAADAQNEIAQSIHLELAERYAALAGLPANGDRSNFPNQIGEVSDLRSPLSLAKRPCCPPGHGADPHQ